MSWRATPNGSPTIPRARRPQRIRRDHRPGEAASCAVSQSPPSIGEGVSPATRGAGGSPAAQSAPCGTGAAVDVCERAPASYDAFSQPPRPTTCGAPGDKAEQARGHGSKSVREYSNVALGVDRCAVPTPVLVEPGLAPRTRYGSDRPVPAGPSGPPCSGARPTESVLRRAAVGGVAHQGYSVFPARRRVRRPSVGLQMPDSHLIGATLGSKL